MRDRTRQILKGMAFFQNMLLSNKHVETDMETDNHSDIELDDMEAGSRSIHYTHSDSTSSALDPGSAFSYSFPAPNSGSEGGSHAPSLPFPLSFANLPPAQMGTILNMNRKCSQNDDRITKVW